MGVRATAKVQVTIELSLDDAWGEDCTVGQIHKQSCDGARNTLNNKLSLIKAIESNSLRIIYPIKVTGIIYEQQN